MIDAVASREPAVTATATMHARRQPNAILDLRVIAFSSLFELRQRARQRCARARAYIKISQTAPFIARICREAPQICSGTARRIYASYTLPWLLKNRCNVARDKPATGNSWRKSAMYDMKNLTKFKKFGELAPEAF